MLTLITTLALAGDPAASTKASMANHWIEAETMRTAIIMGDLEKIHGAAARLKSEFPVTGMPPAAAVHEKPVQDATQTVADSKTLAEATVAVAELASACGGCHSHVAKPATFYNKGVETDEGLAGTMEKHQVAAEWMWAGLIAPSDELYAKGAKAMSEAKMSDKGMPVEFEKRIHDITRISKITMGWPERAQAYGKVLEACQGCHKPADAK